MMPKGQPATSGKEIDAWISRHATSTGISYKEIHKSFPGLAKGAIDMSVRRLEASGEIVRVKVDRSKKRKQTDYSRHPKVLIRRLA